MMTGNHERGAARRPVDDEEELAALDRPRQGDAQGAPAERLYLRRKRASNGRPFFDLRQAFRNEVGAYTFLRAGTSIRMHEAPEIVARLWSALDPKGKARVRELLTEATPADGGRTDA